MSSAKVRRVGVCVNSYPSKGGRLNGAMPAKVAVLRKAARLSKVVATRGGNIDLSEGEIGK